MKIGQNTYKLILLDTNALREIVTNTNLFGKGFLHPFLLVKAVMPPCFNRVCSCQATVYQVETKRLNEAVKRNIARFPNEFRSQLNEKEKCRY